MEHYTFTHAPIGNVVKEIRRISGLSASKELPLSSEETLLLWINKSAQAAHSRQQQMIHEVLQEDNPLRKRNTCLKLMSDENGMEALHKASSVCDLYDGQGVAATLIYYDQKYLCWNGENLFYYKYTVYILTGVHDRKNVRGKECELPTL